MSAFVLSVCTHLIKSQAELRQAKGFFFIVSSFPTPARSVDCHALLAALRLAAFARRQRTNVDSRRRAPQGREDRRNAEPATGDLKLGQGAPWSPRQRAGVEAAGSDAANWRNRQLDPQLRSCARAGPCRTESSASGGARHGLITDPAKDEEIHCFRRPAKNGAASTTPEHFIKDGEVMGSSNGLAIRPGRSALRGQSPR